MKLTAKIMVVFARRYSFTDEKTNKLTEGVSMHYVTEESSKSQDTFGSEPSKGTLPIESWTNDLLPGVGWYDCEFETVQQKNANGSTVTVLKPLRVKFSHNLAPSVVAGVIK